MEKNDMSCEVDITLKHSDEIEKILNEFKSFGEVEVAETDVSLNKDLGRPSGLGIDTVIVVEQYGDVYLITSDGKLQKQLLIPGGAFSVTQINQDTIDITYITEKTIKIFNMENETVTKVIKLDKICWGLSFSNNYLAAGLITDEIRIIDEEGNTRTSIQIQSK
ncbi:unnamed protein product [Mytilus coruscus]|uniref:Uncharacterized protein n=1 Tax=Mytilus coruscus TaxID=42192 RepID=A0A6J8D676_MYTCO|nr:unnamed protein product [Mytilus coruscus]